MNIINRLIGRKKILYSEKTPDEIIYALKKSIDNTNTPKYFEGKVEEYHFELFKQYITRSDFSAKIYGQVFKKEDNGSIIKIIIRPSLLTVFGFLFFFYIFVFSDNFGVLSSKHEPEKFFNIFFLVCFLIICIIFLILYNSDAKKSLKELSFLIDAK